MMILVSSSINVSIFHITWLDTFSTHLVYIILSYAHISCVDTYMHDLIGQRSLTTVHVKVELTGNHVWIQIRPWPLCSDLIISSVHSVSVKGALQTQNISDHRLAAA